MWLNVDVNDMSKQGVKLIVVLLNQQSDKNNTKSVTRVIWFLVSNFCG